ncbi:MAG: hypothetical protein MI751_07890, partial [Pseudomonadales bacterium]|nr:hypothetical protein [Pseudomonadales bacterium]
MAVIAHGEEVYGSGRRQAISYQLSAISYQLSAISYQLSAISYQLSAISYQLSATLVWNAKPKIVPD